MNKTLNKYQTDIVLKALYLLAKENNLPLPENIDLICDAIASRNPYDTDLVDCIDVLETLALHAQYNDDYEIEEDIKA